MTDAAPEKVKKPGRGRSKSLTVSQRAEAAALWRSGSVTLDDLSKRYKKTPEMFSRLFTRMGIKKGSGVAEAVKKAEEVIASKAASDIEVTLQRIASVRESHFKMTQQLTAMAYREIVQAKAAELDVGRLKEVISVYKMMLELSGTARKEMFELLNVEKHEKSQEMDDLPELTVRELTQNEITDLQGAPIDDLDGADLGDGMLDLEDDDV